MLLASRHPAEAGNNEQKSIFAACMPAVARLCGRTLRSRIAARRIDKCLAAILDDTVISRCALVALVVGLVCPFVTYRMGAGQAKAAQTSTDAAKLADWDESSPRFRLLFEHDLFGKPLRTLR